METTPKTTEIHLPIKWQENAHKLQEFAEQSKELSIIDIHDTAGYKQVYDALQKGKKTRTALDKQAKEAKRKVKQQITQFIDGPLEKMLKILDPVIDELQSKREAFETAKAEAQEKAFMANLQPLLDAGLEDRGSGIYAIGNITITKAQINKADMIQLFEWETSIAEEKSRIEEEQKLLEEARQKKAEEEKKKMRGVEEAMQQPEPSAGVLFDAGTREDNRPGPNSGSIPPEHGRHRSALSHVQEIRDYIQEMKQESAWQEQRNWEKAINFIDKKIEELKTI